MAKAKGQTERLAALDKLEGKENERYAAQVVRRKSALGERMHRGAAHAQVAVGERPPQP